jgi:lipopolysaccharide export LptBFGC system permease protein LptF
MPMKWWERLILVLALAAVMLIALVIALDFPPH